MSALLVEAVEGRLRIRPFPEASESRIHHIFALKLSAELEQTSRHKIHRLLTFTPSAADDIVSLENNYVAILVDFKIISSSGNAI